MAEFIVFAGSANPALAAAVERGATKVESPRGPGELEIPAIEGIGGSLLYLVDRYGGGKNGGSIYDVDFEFFPDWRTREARSTVR